jgi:hypothetical protein
MTPSDLAFSCNAAQRSRELKRTRGPRCEVHWRLRPPAQCTSDYTEHDAANQGNEPPAQTVVEPCEQTEVQERASQVHGRRYDQLGWRCAKGQRQAHRAGDEEKGAKDRPSSSEEQPEDSNKQEVFEDHVACLEGYLAA